MFVKIANMDDLNGIWMNAEEMFPNVSNSDRGKIYESISQLVNILCDVYGGEDRNPEVEGGNIIIFYDKHADAQREHIMEHYHLSEDEYEIRDVLTEENEKGYIWVSDIYCGTNYNTVMIYRRLA